ncbi:MAG: nicotinate (nicotinamide) nucleotide adenylyltransferase [Akkermansiaceae bacterium]
MKASPPARKIGIFGGTFDPVHHGHLYLAGLAREALGLDEVRFVPCRISPHKEDRAVTRGEDRCEMLRLATAELPWAVVDDFEIRQVGPSFSCHTAEEMTARFPGARLFWIMGGDQWEALPRWKNPEQLADLVEFIVLARGAVPAARAGYRLHLVQGAHPASASAIRRAISEGETEPPWLAPVVAKWINSRALYRR